MIHRPPLNEVPSSDRKVYAFSTESRLKSHKAFPPARANSSSTICNSTSFLIFPNSTLLNLFLHHGSLVAKQLDLHSIAQVSPNLLSHLLKPHEVSA